MEERTSAQAFRDGLPNDSGGGAEKAAQLICPAVERISMSFPRPSAGPDSQPTPASSFAVPAECGPVVGPSVGVPHRMGQLMLDDVRPKARPFIQKCSCHGPKAMTCHLFLTDTHAAKGSQDGVLAQEKVGDVVELLE